jgi:uncharacterized membrane protein HdeD (DUF308 family)
MRSLATGTASLPDVTWATWTGTLARKLGRSVTEWPDGPGRGVLGIAFGVVVVAWPEASLAAMVLAFAVYALVDGLVSFAGLLGPGRSWTLVAQGIVGIAVGVLAVARPEHSRAALVWVLAVWVVVMGAFRLRAAVDVGESVTVRWTPAVPALLGVVAGCTVLVHPDHGLPSLMVNIAVFPVLHGVAVIAAAGGAER